MGICGHTQIVKIQDTGISRHEPVRHDAELTQACIQSRNHIHIYSTYKKPLSDADGGGMAQAVMDLICVGS